MKISKPSADKAFPVRTTTLVSRLAAMVKPAAPASAPADQFGLAGGGMDRPVIRSKTPRNVILAALALAVIGGASALYLAAPGADTQTIAAERVRISPVTTGEFEDFLPLRARVTPRDTVFLDSVEGGRVEEVLVEDGAFVQQGELLAILSNAELQLSVLARQTEVTQQLNSMRSQELALEQTRAQNVQALLEAELAAARVERQYAREKPLAERGFVAARVFDDTRDELAYQRRRVEVLRQSTKTDERLQAGQLAELRGAAQSMQQGLGLARDNLEALKLRAPVSGQLSSFAIQVGQSLARGERLGQIDSAGQNKLTAGVDEFYLDRVEPGQTGVVAINGKDFAVRVSKVYPQVRNGQFEIDLRFAKDEPDDLRRGQSLQLRLSLSDPTPARLVPNGAFYNDTGGNWIFVVAPDGKSAVKRTVRLGRRNSEFIEVLDGLEPGEQVLTSPYAGFADKDRLDLTEK